MSVFHEHLKRAIADVRSHAGVDVIYKHQSGQVAVKATVGSFTTEFAEESGIVIQSKVWDFIANADALGVVPEQGDWIEFSGRKYEVMSLGDGVWRWSDPTATEYRIHTRDVGAA